MTDFQDKLAVVFGGGRDIGGAVAIELARRGAQVALSYHGSNPDKVIAAITAVGEKAYSQRVDALDMSAIRAFATSCAKQAGKKIDVLVNVVGGLVARKRMEEMDDAFWDQVLTLNLKSIFAMTQAALPLMTDGAAIVNVSSQAGRDGGGPGGIAYGASKGALMSMTRGLAKELGPRKIRVNAVCPGMIATKFHDEFTKPEVRQRVAGMTRWDAKAGPKRLLASSSISPRMQLPSSTGPTSISTEVSSSANPVLRGFNKVTPFTTQNTTI